MLSEIYRREVGLNVTEFQIILEICLDREGFDNIADKMTEMSCRQFQDGDYVNNYYRYLQTQYNLSESDIKGIKKRVFEYTLEKTRDSLIPEVIKTEFIRKMLAKNLGGRFREIGLRVTEELMDFVIQSFSNYAGRYSKDKFELSSGNVKPYIQNCFGYYFQANYADISRYASQQSTIVKTAEGEESIYDLDIKLSLEQHVKRNLTSFKRLANNILYASELLFNHKGVVFYDLWTRVKDRMAVERYGEAKKCIKRDLNYSYSSRILMSESYSREMADNESYRTGIFNARQKLLTVFEGRYNKLFTPKVYKNIFNTLKEINDREPDANNKRFFKGKLNKKNSVSDTDKFLAIVYAFAAISELLEYLEAEGIDPLTVPSTIFRKREYLNKFNTFEEYLKLHDTVVKLNTSTEEINKEIPTNDNVSEYLYREQKSGLGKIKLVDIKKVLEGEHAEIEASILLTDDEKVFIRNMYMIFRKYEQTFTKKLEWCLSLAKASHEKLGIKIFSNDYKTSGVYRWLPPNEKLGDFANSDKILSIFMDSDKELLDKLPKDENMLYNVIRYCSLSKAVVHVLGDIAEKLLLVKNRLDLLDVISNEEAYINLPSIIGGPNDISTLLKMKHVILCKPNFEDKSDTQISIIYNHIVIKFQRYFEVVRRIRDREYNTLKINGVQASSVYERYKEKLVEISRSMLSIYDNVGINNARFIKILMNCTRDEGDYLLYNNCPVTTIKYNSQYFLHSLGYWISPQVDGDLSIIKIREDEAFI